MNSGISTTFCTVLRVDFPTADEYWEEFGEHFEPWLLRAWQAVRVAITRAGGTVEGAQEDALLGIFDHRRDALQAALDAVAEVRGIDWPLAIGALVARIAVAEGALSRVQLGATRRWRGAALRLVERVARAGHPGQILVVADCARHESEGETDGIAAPARRPPGSGPGGPVDGGPRHGDAGAPPRPLTVPLGLHRLPGIDDPVRIERLIPPWGDPTENGALPQAPLRTLSPRGTNLTRSRDLFVGRRRERMLLERALLSEKDPLITLTGPPGVGKSRLAHEVLVDLLEEFPGGCWRIEIEATAGPDAIARATAAALGAEGVLLGPARDRVGDLLEFRDRLVILYDRADRSPSALRSLLASWRERDLGHRFIATSGTAVGLSRERAICLEPLDVPASTASPIVQLEKCESVALLLDRGRRADPTLELRDSTAATLAEVAQLLDGFPLLLELAAARLRVLSPAQLLEELRQESAQSSICDAPARGALERVSTLIDGSLSDLSEELLRLHHACTVFRGGFDLEAAEGVLAPQLVGTKELVDRLQLLVERSLLAVRRERGVQRFRLWAPVREVAEGNASGVLGPALLGRLHRRHAEYYLKWVRRWREHVHGPRARTAVECLEREHANLVAAHDSLLSNAPGASHEESWEEGVTDLAIWSCNPLVHRGTVEERSDRLRATLHRLEDRVRDSGHGPPGHDRRRAALLAALAEVLEAEGELGSALEHAERAQRLAMRAGAPKELATALLRRGKVLRERNDLAAALEDFRRAERLFRGADELPGVSAALLELANLHRRRGEQDEALSLVDAAERIADRLDDPVLRADLLNKRGMLVTSSGELTRAVECFRTAEAFARDIGDARRLGTFVGNRGVIHYERSEFEEALRCFDESLEHLRALGDRGGTARGLANRGNALRELGRPRSALRCYRESEQLYASLGEHRQQAMVLGNRGLLHGAVGDLDESVRCLELTVQLLAETGDEIARAEFIHHLGEAYRQRGAADLAVQCFEAAASTMDSIGNAPKWARSVGQLGHSLIEAGRPREAETRLEQCLEKLQAAGCTESAEGWLTLSGLARAHEILGGGRRQLELEQRAEEMARRLARSGVTVPPPSSHEPGGASPHRPGGPAALPPVLLPVEGLVLGGVRLGPLIGRGGMGAVYRGVQVKLEREVAVKILSPALLAESRAVDRFRREARTIGRFDHPAIVQVHDVVEEADLHCIVMELIDGPHLGELAKRSAAGVLDAERAAELFTQALAGMAEAERLGVVHRDIKPSNLLLHRGTILKISDFGVARSLGEESDLTRPGAPIGTPLYMSPEQRAGHPLDGRSDMYSLGATFLHLLTGIPPPFAEEADAEGGGFARRAREIRARGLGRMLLEMTAADPVDRPESFAALVDRCRGSDWFL